MQKFKNCLKNKQENFIVTFIFLAPSLLGFSVFYIIPFIVAGVYSFFDSSFGASFVALRNYMDLINNPVFRLAVKNTLVFTVISVPLSVFISLGLALILNGDVFLRVFLRQLLFYPWQFQRHRLPYCGIWLFRTGVWSMVCLAGQLYRQSTGLTVHGPLLSLFLCISRKMQDTIWFFFWAD